MMNGYILHRRPAKAQASLHILARACAVCRHVVDSVMKLQAKKHMSVAQIGDCAYAFKEPQTRNRKVTF